MKSSDIIVFKNEEFTVYKLAEKFEVSPNTLGKKLDIPGIEVYDAICQAKFSDRVKLQFGSKMLTAYNLAKSIQRDFGLVCRLLMQYDGDADMAAKVAMSFDMPFQDKDLRVGSSKEKKTYEVDGIFYTIKELCEEFDVGKTAFNKYLKEGKSPKEAIEIIHLNLHKIPWNGEMLTVNQIIQKEGVSKKYAEYHIKNRKTTTTEDIENLVASYKKYEMIKLIDEDGIETTLKNYCTENGYNYRVIYYLIKEHKLSVDDALTVYLEKGQALPAYFKYSSHRILTRSLCYKYQLDPDYLISKIRDGKTLIEAFEETVFFSNSKESQKDKITQFNLYRRLSSYSYDELKEALAVMREADTIFSTSGEDTIFSKKYNKITLIKRDLFYLEAMDQIETLSPEDTKVLIKSLGLNDFDIRYMNSQLLEDFEVGMASNGYGNTLIKIRQPKVK